MLLKPNSSAEQEKVGQLLITRLKVLYPKFSRYSFDEHEYESRLDFTLRTNIDYLKSDRSSP